MLIHVYVHLSDLIFAITASAGRDIMGYFSHVTGRGNPAQTMYVSPKRISPRKPQNKFK